MTDSFSIPLQALTTATGTQSSASLTLDPQVWDAIRFAADCAECDKEEAWAYVRALIEQQKGISQDGH